MDIWLTSGQSLSLKMTYVDHWYPYRWTKHFFIDLGLKVPCGLLNDILPKITPGIPTVAGKSPSSKMSEGDPWSSYRIYYQITTTLIQDLMWSLVLYST